METTNLYLADPSFRRRIARVLGDDIAWGEAHLSAMGEVAGGEADALAFDANRFTPWIERYDRQGERIDEVRFHPSYERLRDLSYGNGIVGLAYEDDARPGGGRAPQSLVLALGYLFGQAENGLFCPICMTNGAARVIERFAPAPVAERFVPRLASRDAGERWEGAMWLTEKQGGSDVGANETVARRDGDRWLLTGDKWFTSNAGAEVMLVLARPEGAPPGTAGLSLFIVRLHREDGSRNGIRFRRLKDKLGTRSMPTAESHLEDAEATLLAAPPAGFKAMAEMINLSRLYNAVASCACIRRGLVEAVAWADERRAFGRLLRDHPLHREVLADLAVEAESSAALTFEAARLIDAVDAGTASDEEATLLRALTPVAKLLTAKQAVAATSEAIECLGGNGYVEEFVTARLLRDAQVLPIWEGTTNILGIDLLARAFGKSRAHDALLARAERALACPPDELTDAAATTLASIRAVREAADAAIAAGGDAGGTFGVDERVARDLAIRAGRAAQALLLLEDAARDLEGGDRRAALIARRHVARHIQPLPPSGIPALDVLDGAEIEAVVRGTTLAVAAS